MSFEAIVLGVGDAFSTRYFPASLLLVADGFRLAIDCPDRYPALLAAAARRSGRTISLSEIDDVLVTHLHGDHVNGLESAAFFKHLVERRRLRLHASREVLADLWPRRLLASMGTLWDGERLQPKAFDDYFAATPLLPDHDNVIGSLGIRTRPTRHHLPTTALLVEYRGRRLGYSADTAFDPGLVDFLAPADLIIHETNLGPGHTPLDRLLGLPADLRARLRLIHYPDAVDPATLPIRALHEGEVLTLCP
jgi:ribonuclease BN (tRNA processing enzyme)